MDDVKLSDIIQDLNQKVDAVYRHGTLQERYSAIARDYGEGFVLTESEAHTLGYVCEMGEATVTDLADYSFRNQGHHIQDAAQAGGQRPGRKISTGGQPEVYLCTAN